ncbi:pseudaminic acid cytidylyltransferase [Gymnodinialimonas ceratoperidinii]|uniref:Pseudaminic acid cytidylyltransferase n=1 Tax=Gymnodinialimonas ceratoperidinii TaxID=2856823 RepID=A0A8F6YAU0_9RHOB|nr:pseudaminic acid cytidylyltransferase [Gymnodinialimonas ceratoperidinii]QXT39381.1 pseudaminic acid cytidylyltransferase [Gymnodinialimonas ceratoperidinii]
MNLCVIPARGGSKRIPRKNVRPFCGKPMIGWSIEAAQASGLFQHVIVSTDDPEIAEVARAAGAEVPFTRPANLSDDSTATVPVIIHALAEAEALWGPQSHVCCLYATAPFVRPEDMRAARGLLDTTGADYAFPVTTFPFPVQRGVRLRPDGRLEMLQPEHALTRSQDLEEAYHDTGQFYWGRREAWRAGKPLMGPDAVPLIIPRHRAQDIDTPEDWDRAEQMFTLLRQPCRKLVIRADAGLDVGAGHVMRCLALAEELDGEANFVCRREAGHLGELIAARGHRVQYLDPTIPVADDAQATARHAADAELVIVDHYGLDAKWEREMPCPVVAIDDCANRPHECDILLDQNLGRRAEDYDSLLPDQCQRLIGPDYALLRPEFARHRAESLARRARMEGGVARLQISLGGGDMGCALRAVLRVLAKLPRVERLRVEVILGAAATGSTDIAAAAGELPCPVEVVTAVDDMAARMAQADLAIGAGGSSSWERCTLGLPTICLPLAANQAGAAAALAEAGAARTVAPGDDAALGHALGELLGDAGKLRAMSAAAAAICNGAGRERVAAAITDTLSWSTAP